MKAVSIANAEHYRWGNQCDGWHLVRAAELSIIEESMPADTEPDSVNHGDRPHAK